ncbi:ATP-grasp domain-containing protein [Streptomyces sp. AC602_WCS936]|uniref:ATP-grasp domain-containing protein n=1 Tax=Streptomyces sp. AC602_WCS936 TaxID=2823685 RepID=UPI001C256698|nr:ATP-grasp domain-containing protein [Streptomyces sp. AC602_WCS936]
MAQTHTNKRLVLVGAGVMAEGYLRAAQTLGVRVGVVETTERYAALRAKYPDIADFEPVDAIAVERDEAWLAPAMTLAGRLRPHGVWGFAEPHVLATSILQHRFKVAGPGLDTSVISRNKAFQRGEFARAGLRQPEHRHTDRLTTASQWALSRLPVVVKPVALQGSRGVERIDTPDDWHGAVLRRDSEGPLLVEEYIEGQEYSVEALVRDGQILFCNLTRKDTTGAPFFVELLHEAGFGAGRPLLRRAVRELCEGVVTAMRVSTGIVHLEFRARADNDLVIMEVAVRTPGDHIMEIVSRAHGCDLYEACVRLALGEIPELPTGDTPVRSAGSLFLSAERTGTLLSLDLDDWGTRSGVAHYAARLAPGARVRPAESSGDRLAYAVLDCAEPQELRALTDELRRGARTDIAEPADASAAALLAPA